MIIFHPTSVLDHSMGDLDVVAYSCIENRESGDWYIEATFPIDSPIVKDTIIVVPTKDSNKQPFRVEEITSTNVIEVKAYHIGFDLKRYGVELSTTISGSCQAALNELKFQAYDTVPFTFTTDIVGNQTFSIIDTDVYSGLLDIADRYNGKVVFDWMTVSIQSSIGADRGMVLEYGKNIRENEVNEDWSKVVTKLKPIGTEGITLTPEWLIADIQYSKPYTRIMQFDSDEASNLALVAQLYLDRYKFPRVNYKVKGNPSFIASGFPYLSLFTYEELEIYTHEELSNLNEQYYFELGDLILVKARQFQTLTEVIQYTYNTLSGFVESVEFGNYRPIVRNIVSERFDPIEQSLSITRIKIDEANNQIDLRVSKDEIISAINLSLEAIKIQAPKISLEGIITANGNVKIDEDGNIEVNDGTFKGSITAESGKVGRFDINGDDLVYTSDLFDYPYDYSDVAKLRRILAGLITQTAYDLAVYDVNNSGTLTTTDLTQIRAYVEGTGSITPKKIRSVIRIGTTSGEIKTSAVAQNGSVGKTSRMRADKLTGDLIDVESIAAKTLFAQQISFDGDVYRSLEQSIVLETGSNSNGRWIKYGDGTMECFGQINVTATLTSTWGGQFTSGLTYITLTYPQTFTSVDYIDASGLSSTGPMPCKAYFMTIGLSSGTYFLATGASTTSRTYVLRYKIVGRWKS